VVTWLRFPAWFNGFSYYLLLEALGNITETGVVIKEPNGINNISLYTTTGALQNYFTLIQDTYTVRGAKSNAEACLTGPFGAGLTAPPQPIPQVVSTDLSAAPPPTVAEAVGKSPSIFENVCMDRESPSGLVYPRVVLTAYYRQDALAALAAAGRTDSSAFSDDWEGLLALLQAHKESRAAGLASLPQHGLCVTTHPDCGRLGDVLAAIAASILQTRGTQQGYVYDLSVPPPSAVPLVGGQGWQLAAETLRRLLGYNAPDVQTYKTMNASTCHDMSPHFLAGQCMVGVGRPQRLCSIFTV
jgi:hypothetical protein